MGTIFGQIFNAVGKRGDKQKAQRSEESPQETERHIREHRSVPPVREVHHHHYHHHQHGQSSKSDDTFPIFFVITALALLVALFLFAAYLPQIADTLYFFITTVAVFSITAGISATLSGRFNTVEWWLHTIGPALTSIGCFWVTSIAHAAISPKVVSFAHGLIANQPMSFKTVLTGAVTFVRSTHNEYVLWMTFVMLAFVVVLASTVICAMQCVYYIALANVRDSGGSGWRWIVSVTQKFSGLSSLFFAWFLLAVAWFLASGEAYRLTH